MRVHIISKKKEEKEKCPHPPEFLLPRPGFAPTPARVFPHPPGSAQLPHRIYIYFFLSFFLSFPSFTLHSPLHLLPPSISLSSSITLNFPNSLSSNSSFFIHQKYLKISSSSSSSHSLSHSLNFFHQFLHSFKSPSFHISLFILIFFTFKLH